MTFFLCAAVGVGWITAIVQCLGLIFGERILWPMHEAVAASTSATRHFPLAKPALTTGPVATVNNPTNTAWLALCWHCVAVLWLPMPISLPFWLPGCCCGSQENGFLAGMRTLALLCGSKDALCLSTHVICLPRWGPCHFFERSTLSHAALRIGVGCRQLTTADGRRMSNCFRCSSTAKSVQHAALNSRTGPICPGDLG